MKYKIERIKEIGGLIEVVVDYGGEKYTHSFSANGFTKKRLEFVIKRKLDRETITAPMEILSLAESLVGKSFDTETNTIV